MDKNKGEQKTIVKIICLLLSFGLWLYVTNVENPIKTNTITNVEVEIQGDNKLSTNKFALSPNQKFTVDLEIEGKATDIYRASKNDFKVVADLGAYALKKGENTIPVQVVEKPTNVNIRTSAYLSIKVMVEELKSKEVQVTSGVVLTYKDGIYGNPATVTPDKIRIEGPESSVDKVKKVSLVGEMKDISADAKGTFPIKAFDEGGNEVKDITLSQNEGTIEVKVSEGKIVPIKLKTTGTVPSGIALDGTELSRTTLEISGNKDILKNITSLETEPVDLSSISSNKELNIKVIIPQGVKIVSGNEYVTVKVKVSSTITSREIDVPIGYVNLEKNSLVLNDDRTKAIKIKVSGETNAINSLNPSDFIAQIDLKGKKEGTYEEVPDVKLATPNSSITIEVTDKAKYTLSLK
ncbi:MAG: CdaR family protein [Clostridium sp.]